jgi:hypothetical protein
MPDLYGDVKGEFRITLSLNQLHHLEFKVQRRCKELGASWGVKAEMTRTQLLQLRNTINAEVDRAFIDAGPKGWR